MKEKTFMLKEPQHNLEAEASVLGAILVNSENLYKAEEYVTADDFYSIKNKTIFESFQEIRDNHESIDVLTLSEKLKRKNVFEKIGGVVYLTNIVTEIPLMSNFEGYCKIVKDSSLVRKLADTSIRIYQRCYEEYENVSDLIEESEKEILNVGEWRMTGDFSDAKEVVKETMAILADNMKNKGKMTGLATGFDMLDKYTSGLQRSDLIYIAARPSMGKTAFALNIAGHAALRNKKKIAIFSLEMSKTQLMQRLICCEACVDMGKLRNGELDEREWLNVGNAGSKLFNSHIYIDDTGSASLRDVRSKSRRLKANHGLDMIMIDYLQLMNNKNKSENRQAEISEISRGLKALAREMDCPVVCLSQLSRAVDSRCDHRPVLSDLRESGSIEQDADVVLFLYREHYYTPDDDSNINQAELLVSKQRNGQTGKIDLVWRPEWTKFTNSTPES